MQFGSKSERAVWRNALLALIPDAVVAILVAWITESGFVGFIITMVALQVAYFLIWAKNSSWLWLSFWVGGRKRMADHLFDYLRENGFPEPDEYYGSADEYLEAVAGDVNLPDEVRLKAAAEVGVIRAGGNLGRVQLMLQMHLAYDDAIQRYKRGFPARREREDDG